MKVALVINERATRERFADCISSNGHEAHEYATAEKALGKLTTLGYDLVVIHWQVHPGWGASDAKIRDIAALIPTVTENRNLLYWEAALRLIDLLRDQGSPNRTTPVVVIFPETRPFDSDDSLDRESIDADLKTRQPATVISNTSKKDIDFWVTKSRP